MITGLACPLPGLEPMYSFSPLGQDYVSVRELMEEDNEYREP